MSDYSWLSHTATAAVAFATGRILPFLLKWREQTGKEQQNLIDKMSARIETLEKRIDVLHADNLKCHETQGEMRAEIGLLKISAIQAQVQTAAAQAAAVQVAAVQQVAAATPPAKPA